MIEFPFSIASLAPLLLSAGGVADVDPCLLASLGYHESRFYPDAVSKAGAKGPFQFMPATWEKWGEGDFDNAFDMEKAAPAAARYLAWLIDRMDGDVWLAVLCYGWGIGHVRDWLEGGRVLDDIPTLKFDYANGVVRDMLDLQMSGVLRINQ